RATADISVRWEACLTSLSSPSYRANPAQHLDAVVVVHNPPVPVGVEVAQRPAIAMNIGVAVVPSVNDQPVRFFVGEGIDVDVSPAGEIRRELIGRRHPRTGGDHPNGVHLRGMDGIGWERSAEI